jgi:surfeit locus 1 family protein
VVQEGCGLNRRLAIFGAVALLAALGFTGLGFWQLERLRAKNALVAAIEQRIAAEPVDLNQDGIWERFDPERDEYRRVTVRGRFDHGAETLVQAVTAHGGGFWVVTPLVLSDGRSVLVNRGFVPPEGREPGTRPGPEDEVDISGLLRRSEPNGGFLRGNDPVAERWYSRDVEAIAEDKGIRGAAPFFVDADEDQPGAYPIGGLTVLSFPNSHLGYALAWFALAGIVVGGFGYVAWEGRRTR